MSSFSPTTLAHLFPPVTLGSPHLIEDYNDCSTLQALSMIMVDKICQQISTTTLTINNSITFSTPFATFTFTASANFEVKFPQESRSDAYEPIQFTYLFALYVELSPGIWGLLIPGFYFVSANAQVITCHQAWWTAAQYTRWQTNDMEDF
ncbi:unnamed protein product [Lactuca saligna]|uniref:Plastid lipid-associated protein/fibrillin conserved domain-containing protein n=1 Tax=Lactuca saligna TaxID=75948 RepID=A0AA35Z4M5_LACSI|nr:unnamed protein product [Lactuca saligna]